MALIKCSECGKEYSDKAASCPQCACPTPKVENSAAVDNTIKVDTSSEKEIIRSVNDKTNCLIWTIVWSVLSVISIFTCIGIILLFPFAYMIYFTLKSKKEYIVITNKRVYGVKTGSVNERIDFPLSQVSTITSRSVLGINSVVLESTGGSKFTFDYIANAEELSNTFSNMKK